MMQQPDGTHDIELQSWVASANRHAEFPIQNLPLGIFSAAEGQKRFGAAIGDSILDVHAILAAGLFEGEAKRAVEAASGDTLNSFLALGTGPRHALRVRLSELLRDGSRERARVEKCLHEATTCTMHVPATIGDYTDFYVGIHHAENIGRQFRPDNPLLPNYKYVPIGYHGRASSILPSGVPVRRPSGQIKPVEAPTPSFGPSKRLDYELELGVWVGPGNELAKPISIATASEHVA